MILYDIYIYIKYMQYIYVCAYILYIVRYAFKIFIRRYINIFFMQLLYTYKRDYKIFF